MSWNANVTQNFSRNNSNITAHTSSKRAASPSLGRQTAIHHAQAIDWMRRTLIMPSEPSARIPDVFINAERGLPDSRGRSGRRVDIRSLSPVSGSRTRSGGSIGPTRDNHKIVTPSLVADAIAGLNSNSNSNSNPPLHHHHHHLHRLHRQDSWTTTRYQREHTTTGISPHRHSHSHAKCVPLRAPQLARTVVPRGVAGGDNANVALGLASAPSMQATFNNRTLVMGTNNNMSSSRSNTPRWGDPIQLAASRAQSTSSARIQSLTSSRLHHHYPSDEAEVDLIARESVSAVRALQRSANSSLPVCNTVGVDNSSCTCSATGATASGELMVQAIDTLLRANRNDGTVSPGTRQHLIRSNSSPVANRVESIVKKEVGKRLQMERERFEEQERVREEARLAKEGETEARHRYEISKAQREAEVGQQRLVSEQFARARAEAEELATKERLARTRAEEEAKQLREELAKIDSKMVSPGRVRVGEGMQPEGNAERIADVLASNGHHGGRDQNIYSSNTSSGAANRNTIQFNTNSSKYNNNRAASEAKSDDSTDEYSAWNSVRKGAEVKHKVGSGHFDPVSSVALQRQDLVQKNFSAANSNREAQEQTVDDGNNNNKSPRLFAAYTVQSNNNNNNSNDNNKNFFASPLSQKSARGGFAGGVGDGVDSVISQLASAGSSPFSGRGNDIHSNGSRRRGGRRSSNTGQGYGYDELHDDDDYYEDEYGNVMRLRAEQVGQSLVRTGRGGQPQQQQQQQQQSEPEPFSSARTPEIVRAPKIVNGELVYSDGSAHDQVQRHHHQLHQQRRQQQPSPSYQRQGNNIYDRNGSNNHTNNNTNSNIELTNGGGAGGGGPPIVGMKERDAHIMDLMRKTHERHGNVLAAQRARLDARMRQNGGENNNNYNNISIGGNSSPYRSGGLLLDTGAASSAKRPQATLYYDDGDVGDESLIATPRTYDVKSNSPPRHFFSGGGVTEFSDGSRILFRQPAEKREPSSSSFGPSSLSPFRANAGPHYSPETLVEPPLAAGPSGLWVNRVK